MRSMWNGSLGFGLVNIPVRMYLATEESRISFVQLDKKDHARVRYKKVNEVTGKELQQEDIVRGYPMNNTYVIVDDADLQKAAPEKVDHIDIVQFVNENEINALYYENHYFLEPDKVGAKAYILIRDALTLEGKAAIGRLVFHGKEWLCLIKPLRKVLALHKLRFSDEIRSEAGLVIPDAAIKNDELKMASLLIAQLSRPFKAEEYTDTYSAKVLEVIEAKARGKSKGKQLKIVHTATTDDLMEKLKASLHVKRKKAS
ncbi:Ku protein [Niastella caeni]|uniref:Non-homologous end joining protein Ku n=1 Tax=Niastella caeni TaxID=2569763 RepID=A0A4S8HZ20_9BACT|nr:Ku protein [Niastella caeni]THU41088.1 Ku protein [Niastella caeni]